MKMKLKKYKMENEKERKKLADLGRVAFLL